MFENTLTCTHTRRRSTFRSIESDLQASCKRDARGVGQNRAGRAIEGPSEAELKSHSYSQIGVPFGAHLRPLKQNMRGSWRQLFQI